MRSHPEGVLRRSARAALILALGACATPAAPRPEPTSAGLPPSTGEPRADAPAGASSAPPRASAAAPAPPALVRARYPWLEAKGALPATEPLEARFAAPAGFTRVAVAAGSFGEYLRGLPLAAPGTPVAAFDGRTLLAGDDARVAAVAALDVGTADLQQCADSIVRLHAEWRWAGGARDHEYRAASGTPMPFRRWLAGERATPDGATLRWEHKAKAIASPAHADLRRYLDAVFMFANTGALARDAAKIAREELRPGDFFVLAGNPGHAVLVLDVARAPDGRARALLGQGYMPAQRFHVLRASSASPWYTLDDAGGVQTPFWPAPFPWTSLRRLDAPITPARAGGSSP